MITVLTNAWVGAPTLIVWDPNLTGNPYSLQWDGVIAIWDLGKTVWDNGATVWGGPLVTWR